MEQKKELFTEKVSAGSRTYFFDIKESAAGAKYLSINESRKNGEKFESNRIMIFEDNMQPFVEGLRKVYEFMK